jgi:hypothetical protein
LAERTRKYDDAALSFASAVPFAGWGANAAKWGRKALKLPVKEAKLLGVNLAARAACNATWKQAAQGYAAHALKGAATAAFNDAVAQGVGLAVGKQDDWSWGRTLSAGALGSAVSMASYRLSKVCFAAGTPLLTPDGHKNIENFKVGDLILSRSEFNLEAPVEAKVVEEVFVRTGRIIHVHVGGKVIRTTAEHPFYVRGKGWTAAGALRVGDLLASHDGQWVAVEDLLDTGELETVYNVRVAEWHTYFVGGQHWSFSVWAHNQYFQRTEYGLDPLSAMALDARRSSGRVLQRHNLAVAEYLDNAGNVQRRLFKNVQGDKALGRRTMHSEEVMDE